MPLYLIHRPAGRIDLRNTADLHGALVDAAEARDLALAEAGALAASLGWEVEARVTAPCGAFAGAALGRATGDAVWLPLGSARARAA